MLTIISTIGGYIVALIPRVFDRWQDKADKAHELEILHMQMRQQLQLSERGYSPTDKAAELRSDDEQSHGEYMEQMGMIYAQQERMLDNANQWVKNWTAFTRPGVTFIFVFELVLVNLLTVLWVYMHGDKIATVDEFLRVMAIVFDDDEMAMLGTIIAMWFGSRGAKK